MIFFLLLWHQFFSTRLTLPDLLLWLSGTSRICAAHVSCCWWCRAGWFCLCRHASMVPFELYRSEICNKKQTSLNESIRHYAHVEMFLNQQTEAATWDSGSAHNCIVCFWKPLIYLLIGLISRGQHTEWVQKRSVWTWSPTAAEMKGTAWRNISRPSSSRHRKPFFKTSDPSAKSSAFTRPPLWHICQEKIHVCVEREKKKKSGSLGKSRCSFINKRKSTVHYTAAAQGYRRIKDTRTLDSKEKLNKRDDL